MDPAFFLPERRSLLKHQNLEPLLTWIGTSLFVLVLLYYFWVYILAFLAGCGLYFLTREYQKDRDRLDRERWRR